MTNIEVITSVERRQRWPREEKERLVTACLESGAVLSEVARAAGIHVNQLWSAPYFTGQLASLILL